MNIVSASVWRVLTFEMCIRDRGTPELIHYLTDNALDSVHWLESLGVKFKDETGSATGSLGERSHYPATPSGNTYIRAFEAFAADHADQLVVLHETQAKELLSLIHIWID